MVWLSDVKKPSEQPIRTMRFSEKGCIIETAEYDCFLWKSDVMHKHLTEAMNYFTAQGYGLMLFVTPDSREKRGFSVTPDEQRSEQEWFFDPQTGKYSDKLESVENPFLPCTSEEVPPNPLIGSGVVDISMQTATDLPRKNSRKRAS